MKPSGVGGMAVMEGVMMKNKDQYAVAVRKPNNEIAVEVNSHKDFSDKVRLFKLPIFRGMLAFVDSMVVGVKVLNYSASFFEEEEEFQKKNKKTNKKSKADTDDFEIEEVSVTLNKESSKSEKSKGTAKKEASSSASSTLMMVAAVLLSIVISVALFMVLPVILTNLLSKVVTSTILMNLIEGLVRLAIFIGYVILAAKMPEIKRVFMYHGAEHKTINCLEHGCELTVENVKKYSKQHKRCGTSFMLLVILISLVFFMVIPSGNLTWRILSRIILVPFIAGVSYEFIRLAGKTENKVVSVLSQPGLWMQGLTTKEPDDTMIEVAIASVDAVFDWRAFLDSEGNRKEKRVSGRRKKNTAGSSKSAVSGKKETDKISETKQKNGSNQSDFSKKQESIKLQIPSNQNNEMRQDAKMKQNVSVKQDTIAKQTAVRKQDTTGGQDIAVKQDAARKQNAAVKQDAERKQDAAVKQDTARKQDAAVKQNTARKQETEMKQDNALKKTNTSNTSKQISAVKSNNESKNNNPDKSRNVVQSKISRLEEEDDEILRALDKFFDEKQEDRTAESR